MKLLFLLVAALLLSACGSKLDGTYADDSGLINYTFESNGKVTQSTLGTYEVEMNYEVEGNKIKILIPQEDSLVLTLQDDGSIQGPMGFKLSKQKK